MQSLFGTDGIRGPAGALLTPELSMRAAFAFAGIQTVSGNAYRRGRRPRVFIGCDSRLSSPMLKAAAASGVMLAGCDAVSLGTVPTPVVPLMVLAHRAAGGIMITASHNPVADNGLKFFAADGMKIRESQERRIERAVGRPGEITVNGELHFGGLDELDATSEYLAFARKAVPPGRGIRKLSIILDCAHGATCALAPEVFSQAGFSVTPINCTFDGSRVNVKCGATDLALLSRQVKKFSADIGLAFDGDGDRVKAVDENGSEVSGDKIIALFATRLPRYKKQGAAVMTHMTNMGVEAELEKRGIRLLRTDVGDIQVLAAMKQHRLHLGGEQSGHIILRDKAPSGDGILVGLQLASLVRSLKRPLSNLVGDFEEYPQLLVNLRIGDKLGWQRDKRFLRTYDKIKHAYIGVRFYLRPSGTEDVVRVLTEARNSELCNSGNQALCEALQEWDQRIS